MIEIKIGDCTERLKDLEDSSVDAIICDPPYGLKFMAKGWDDIGDGSQQREWHRAWLTEAHRVLKPSGVLKAFSGTRTHHHLIAMMEEVGFSELRVEAWARINGFPKSHNISRAIHALITTGGSAPKNFRKARMGDSYEPTGQKDYRKGSFFSSQMQSERDNSITELCEQAIPYIGLGTALKPAWEPVCIGVKK